MKIIGITGPSGSGKSMLAAALTARGYLHAGAVRMSLGGVGRNIAHNMSLLGLDVRMVTAFGDGILKDGQIDRTALAARVFGAHGKKPLLLLNKITHKYVCRACVKEIRAAIDAGAKGILLDAPLLIEARLDRLCDLVVCVTAPTEIRVRRIVARDGISDAAALRRIRSQPNDAFYLKKCGYLLLNDGDAEKIDAAAREIDLLLSEEHA